MHMLKQFGMAMLREHSLHEPSEERSTIICGEMVWVALQ